MKGGIKITIGNIQANPQYMKFINKKKVLHYVMKNNGQSRTDIAKALTISKPTISKLVEELIEEGWMSEIESSTSSSSGGRKPYHLYFNSHAYSIIGVDIGGTTVEVAIVNLEGEIITHTSFDTQKALQNNLVQTLVDCILELINNNSLKKEEIIGVGIGVPGITNINNGVVIDAPSLGWRDFPLKENLVRHLSFPVYIDNDVNVAALGEQWKGAGKYKDNILQVTLGTGIGCGLIINGELYRGSSFAAGEIGYLITDKNAAEESYDPIFTGYGFLDSHVGGASIANRMLTYQQDGSDEWTAERVFKMALNGDKTALDVVNDAFSHLAFALINIITIVNPECVVLGGGISKSIHSFLPSIIKTIEKHLPIKTDITITKLEHVSLIGAAFLIMKEHETILQK